LAVAAALSAVLKDHPAVFDRIRDYMLAGGAGKAGKAQYANPLPLITKGGKVLAYPQGLAGLCAEDMASVHEALAPFRDGERVAVKMRGGAVVRYFPLDPIQLWDALGFSGDDVDAVGRAIDNDTETG
jgi:hypothetical protein